MSQRRVSGLGREEALAAVEEAAQLRRGLVATDPDEYTPDLASSLHNMSVQLSGLGRREEALAAVEEAAQLFERAASHGPTP